MQGMREVIMRVYGLRSTKVVKQFAHCVLLNMRVFYEPLGNKESIQKLHEGDIIVWTKVRLAQ